jgi:deoxyribonuclease-2
LHHSCISDQPPPSKFTDNATQYGHSKGVAAWTADDGFWIVHSFPEFPPRLDSGYTGVDESQQIYGQSVLCVSTDTTGMDVVGQQLQYNFAQIYEVNAPSYTPPTLMATAEGQHVTEPEASMRDLVAIDKTTFTSFSKSGEWGKRLYADLVAPVLKSDLLVETWIRGSKIPSECPSDGYSVKNVQQLQFPGQLFKETQDHSKWAITLNHSIVCIGGINQMTSQNKRGGGTLCLPNKDLWTSFNDAVYAVEPCE